VKKGAGVSLPAMLNRKAMQAGMNEYSSKAPLPFPGFIQEAETSACPCSFLCIKAILIGRNFHKAN